MRKKGFETKDLPVLAQQAITVIKNGQDVLDFIASKGMQNPIEEWYSLRRWMKSNTPQLYACIPVPLRLELQQKNDNPDAGSAQEPAEAAEPETPTLTEPEEQPKKRLGRPPKVKDEFAAVVHTLTEEKSSKLRVQEVSDGKISFKRRETGICITILGRAQSMTVTFDEVQMLLDELPEVIKTFKN